MLTIGLISDTHGLVRPEVFDALAGVDLILHAGDVGPPEVLVELAAIAPVRAVWGNTDAPGRTDLVERIDEMFEQVRVVVTHGHEIGSPNPPRLVSAYMHADVIVYGHTHQQLITRAARRMVINPGAAGARRFKLQPSVAKLFIDGRQSDAQIITLLDDEPLPLLDVADME
ncbi:MAG: metallophosphoesterase family protein [Gemmatimonadaceae bacterium]|nr:metallophosphoesterase family protein [Gemmatimonadaceae bacterium]